MRTYGQMELRKNNFDEKFWIIKAEPHVMIRLKAVIKRINAYEFGTVHIKNSDEVCRDLEWFISGKTKVFVMSLRTGAGLDGLQEKCSTIVHEELDWSPGVHEQCRGRYFRDGRQRDPG